MPAERCIQSLRQSIIRPFVTLSQRGHSALLREANLEEFKINESKTKHIIAAGNDRPIRDVGQSVAIGDKTFEVVKEFVYLGSLMTPDN
jgi:hypothetical protein